MPRYLLSGRFSAQGAEGITREGGSSRRDTIEELAAAHGGTLEGFYFAFGATDMLVILDLPNNETAAAIALAIGSSGAVGVAAQACGESPVTDRNSLHRQFLHAHTLKHLARGPPRA